MSTEVNFDYHYGNEAEQYAFYRVPKMLFTNECFKGLSDSAKLLYGLMLDRMSLSIKNKWLDDKNRVFIIFTLDSVKETMGCGNEKAVKMLAELDKVKGVGLIERVKLGQGKPSIIYVRKFVVGAEFKTSEKPKSDVPAEVQTSGKPISKRMFLRKSRLLKIRSQGFGKAEANYNDFNNTEENKTEISDTESIYPSILANEISTDGMDEIEYNQEFIFERLNYYDRLLLECRDPEQLDELMALLLDVFQSKKDFQRVNGEERPTRAVQGQLLKLTADHIIHVLDTMRESTVPVKNMRSYLLTSLYNAPMTMLHSVGNQVQHDLYGSG